MKTASSLFTLILLGSLVADAVAQVSYQEPAPAYIQTTPYIEASSHHPLPAAPHQLGRIISRRTQQTLRRWEDHQLTDLLRLSMNESRDLEVISVSVRAQALRAQTHLQLKSLGRSIAPSEFISRNLKEVRFLLPLHSRLEDLELSPSDDLILDTLTVEVRDRRGNYYEQRPYSNQLLHLRINRSFSGWGELNLKQLAKQQLALDLEGAQIQRVIVQGHLLRGSSATVQVELNHRPIGPVKRISYSSRQTPLPINTIESVLGSLNLLVRGEVQITKISIRVGNVRQIRY